MFREVERTLARASDALVAVSPEVRDDLVGSASLPPEKFVVVRLGIPLADRLDDESEDSDYRQLYGIRRGRVRRRLGRPHGRRQGHRATCSRRFGTARAGVNAVACLVGDGPDREPLEELAHRLGVARACYFAGYQPDVAGFYRMFDAFFLPSVNEGTPVSAIEALAPGLPVVANRVGGVPDVVPDGDRRVPRRAGDVDAAAARLEELARDPALRRRSARRAASASAPATRSTRLVDDVDRLYRSLLETKS